ncbi:MAG: efflux RND transporter periplasmic adaptor subunit [Magnetococcus sp. DMHC-1]|nr:efflux RND transporter periplasmic adaptor subunit [Magnetococcales bacterium]
MRLVTSVLWLIVGMVLLQERGWAHGGEEHADAAPRQQQEPLVSGSGHGGNGDLFEIVVTPTGDGTTRLYLSDLETNLPIEHATIHVDVAGSHPWTGQGTSTQTPGMYRLAWMPPSQETADLTLTVMVADRSDLLLIQVPGLSSPPAFPASPASPASLTGVPDIFRPALGRLLETTSSHTLLLPGAGALIAIGLVVWLVRRKKSRQAAAGMVMIVVALAGSGFPVTTVQAHGGEEHGSDSGEKQPPERSATGTIVSGSGITLPKASQFLLDVRTVSATSREVAETIRLVGRVIPDPAAHAHIHPSVLSRIGYDPDFPVPRSGQWVKKGETLAVLDPVLSATEKVGQRLALFKGDRAESSVGREMVQAPIDGQLTDLHIVPGDVVTESTILAEIIDPMRLWVEAILYDLHQADRITAGTALTRQIPGQTFPLHLIGVSPKVNPENQGLHLQFAVQQTHNQLKLGMPVDVYAATKTVTFAVAVPRSAVLEQNGIPRVWVKTAPERFAGHPVRVGRKTAEWVEILDGIQPGDKVVVQGHNQLNAIR